MSSDTTKGHHWDEEGKQDLCCCGCKGTHRGPSVSPTPLLSSPLDCGRGCWGSSCLQALPLKRLHSRQVTPRTPSQEPALAPQCLSSRSRQNAGWASKPSRPCTPPQPTSAVFLPPTSASLASVCLLCLCSGCPSCREHSSSFLLPLRSQSFP